MKKLAAGVMLLAAVGCAGAAGTSATSASPPPVNQPVGSQKPTDETGLITQPMQESQGIGIAQDPGQ